MNVVNAGRRGSGETIVLSKRRIPCGIEAASSPGAEQKNKRSARVNRKEAKRGARLPSSMHQSHNATRTALNQSHNTTRTACDQGATPGDEAGIETQHPGLRGGPLEIKGEGGGGVKNFSVDELFFESD